MRAVDRCTNWLVLAGWVLMASGGAVFFSIVFAGAGIAIFLAGAALCVAGGMTAGLSTLGARLPGLHGHRREPLPRS